MPWIFVLAVLLSVAFIKLGHLFAMVKVLSAALIGALAVLAVLSSAFIWLKRR